MTKLQFSTPSAFVVVE